MNAAKTNADGSNGSVIAIKVSVNGAEADVDGAKGSADAAENDVNASEAGVDGVLARALQLACGETRPFRARSCFCSLGPERQRALAAR